MNLAVSYLLYVVQYPNRLTKGVLNLMMLIVWLLSCDAHWLRCDVRSGQARVADQYQASA